MPSLNFKHYRFAQLVSLVTAVLLFLFSFLIGKARLFLLLNGDGGQAADHLFFFASYLGDGLMWIPVLLITLFVLKRRDAIPLLVAAFAFSTLFTQLFKLVIFPGELRPIRAITDGSYIHTVKGVEVHSLSSFPSGHTGTAFCFYLLFCLMLNNSWWRFAGYLLALLVGYARIYLAQHFPFDVGGGMVVAILSVILSVQVQKYWWKKKINHPAANRLNKVSDAQESKPTG